MAKPRANILTDLGGKISDAWHQNVSDPFYNGVTKVSQAVGLTPKPINPATVPQVDTGRAQALAQYGQTVTQNATQAQNPGQFNYGTYTPEMPANTPIPQSSMSYTPQTYTPTQGGNIPQAQQFQNQQYQQNNAALPDLGMSASQLAAYSKQQAAPDATAGTPTLGKQSSILPANLEYDSSQLNLKNPAVAEDTSQYQNAASRAVSGAGTSLQDQANSLQQGFDPAMRQKAIDLETSGLSTQKTQALADLKEQQMAAGNYGSSAGQTAMSKLSAQYDQQLNNATNNIDVQNMQTANANRYQNVNAAQAQNSQLSSLAGYGQNMALNSGQYQQQGTQANNAVAAQTAQYNQGTMAQRNAAQTQQTADARNAMNTDNSSAMQLAQYGQNANQLNYQNAQQGNQQQFQNQLTAQQFGANQNQQQFQNQTNQGQQNFQNQQNVNQFNQAGQQQYQNQANTAYQNLANYGQQQFQNQQQVNAANQSGLQQQSNEQWQQYNAQNAQAQNIASTKNAAQQFNLENQATANNTNYGRYQTAIQGLANYANGTPYTPQSVATAAATQQQLAQQQQTQGNFVNAVGQVVKGISADVQGGNGSPQPNATTPQASVRTPMIQADASTSAGPSRNVQVGGNTQVPNQYPVQGQQQNPQGGMQQAYQGLANYGQQNMRGNRFSRRPYGQQNYGGQGAMSAPIQRNQVQA